MRTSILLSALLSALSVTALPTTDVPIRASKSETVDASNSPTDGRAATLFARQNLVGGNVATDYTPVPADEGCLDLSNIFGAWDGKTRSLVVNKGFKCEFFTAFHCRPTGLNLSLGSKTAQIVKKTLAKEFDRKINSANCRKL